MRVRWLLAVLVVAGTTPLGAQSSVYGVLGLGFPTDPMGLRARASGGAAAAVDPGSVLNPAAAALFARLTVSMEMEQLTRSHDFAEASASGLNETRFPLGMVGGPVPGTHFFLAGSFSTYLDRTYDISSTDTVTLRGAPVAVSDRVHSRGAVADARLAVAWQVSRVLSIGAGAHVLGGDGQLELQRQFDDPAYVSLQDQVEDSFRGFGVSAGVIVTPLARLRLGAAMRYDGTLERQRDSVLVQTSRLPLTVSGGFTVIATSRLRWSGTGIWRSWSRAAVAAANTGAQAFDTWSLASGIEVDRLIGRAPLRLGARYSLLPFSPTTEQPHEVAVALGTGLRFATNRAQFDFTLERAVRQGGGVTEHGWVLGTALVITP